VIHGSARIRAYVLLEQKVFMSAAAAIDLASALAFANQNPVCWLATCAGEQPHVRGLLMWFADQTGFYFHTGTVKPLSDQLVANPRVEVAFHNPGKGPGDGRMMRVSGAVERLHDGALEARLIRERAWLSDMVAAQKSGTLFLFRIPHGEILDWTMATNLHEREQVPLRF
jgi:pyridoxamine 5'-phosphate oxidase